MDPFSVSTGIAGFISLSLEIGDTIHKYLKSVKSAEEDARTLVMKIEALRLVLDRFVKFLREEEVKGSVAFKETSGLFPVIATCRNQFQTLYEKLRKGKSGGLSEKQYEALLVDVRAHTLWCSARGSCAAMSPDAV